MAPRCRARVVIFDPVDRTMDGASGGHPALPGRSRELLAMRISERLAERTVGWCAGQERIDPLFEFLLASLALSCHSACTTSSGNVSPRCAYWLRN